MNYVLRHTRCPECAKHGNDRTGDNLAIYSDGSEYCFSCGYYSSGSAIKRIHAPLPVPTETIYLPDDVSPELPSRCRDWLGGCGLDGHDITLNTILWSEHWQRLIFPILVNDDLLAWQGRYFGTEKKAKWITKGKIDEIVYTVGNPKASTLVLVEDIISAIKVGHLPDCCVMPLFGSHISTKRLLTIRRFYDMEVVIWLDHDKMIESVKYCKSARDLGLKARTVISDKDPKKYSEQEILDKLKKP